MSTHLHRLGSGRRKNPWIVCARPNPTARFRLFAFPYAGGGASVFRGWSLHAPELETCAVQLPGREGRLGEVAFTHMNQLVPVLADALLPMLDRPYALFGHSIGAIQAFELACEFRRRGVRMPAACFVSGRPAPQTICTLPPVHHLSEREFLLRVRSLNGTPDEIIANAELMALLLPVLRADFELAWSYAYRERPPLTVPIVAFGGDADTDVAITDLHDWRSQTTVGFDARILPGGHFFLHEHAATIMDEIVRRLGLRDGGAGIMTCPDARRDGDPPRASSPFAPGPS